MKLPAFSLRSAIVWLIPAAVLLAGATGTAYACPANADVMPEGATTIQVTACADDHQPAACADHCSNAQSVAKESRPLTDGGDTPPVLPPVKDLVVPAISQSADAPGWHVAEPVLPPARIYLLTARLRI